MRRYCKAISCGYHSMRKYLDAFCFWLVLIAIVTSPLSYWAIVSIPDSTDYFLQTVDSERGSDGRNYIFVGDDLHIRAYNWRHLINGTCLIPVWRNRENVGGQFAGRRHVLQYVEQQFVGDGIIRRTSWPIAPERVQITDDWFDDPTVDEQEMDIFTTGTYLCNPLDHIRSFLGFPRVHHNARLEPERERTRVVLRRHRPAP